MRIDVHAHLWPETYLDRIAELGYPASDVHRGLGAGDDEAALAARFALMDEAGIDMQVLSVTPASAYGGTAEEADAAARWINDRYAALIREYPGRFRAFAALPLLHAGISLRELRRCLDDLGFLGVAVTTSILGRSLADPAFHPLYEELDRRGAVLYVHPAGCGACSPLIQAHRLTWAIGAPVEDTVAAMHLVYARIPSRYPGMKIILSHLGGALPMVMQRVEHQHAWEAPGAVASPTAEAKRMWFDTVAHNHIPALRAAVETFGADRLVLGTDFPYQGGTLFKQAVDFIRRAGLAEAQVAQILDANAASLLGLSS